MKATDAVLIGLGVATVGGLAYLLLSKRAGAGPVVSMELIGPDTFDLANLSWESWYGQVNVDGVPLVGANISVRASADGGAQWIGPGELFWDPITGLDMFGDRLTDSNGNWTVTIDAGTLSGITSVIIWCYTVVDGVTYEVKKTVTMLNY